MYTFTAGLLMTAGMISASTLQVTSFEANSNDLAMTMQVSAGDLFGNFYPGDIASMPSWPYIPGNAINALEWWDGTAQVTVGGSVYQGLGGGWTHITGVLPSLTGGIDIFPVNWSMDVFFSTSLFSPPLFEIKGSGTGTAILDEKAFKFTYTNTPINTPEPSSLWLVLAGIIYLLTRKPGFANM